MFGADYMLSKTIRHCSIVTTNTLFQHACTGMYQFLDVLRRSNKLNGRLHATMHGGTRTGSYSERDVGGRRGGRHDGGHDNSAVGGSAHWLARRHHLSPRIPLRNRTYYVYRSVAFSPTRPRVYL